MYLITNINFNNKLGENMKQVKKISDQVIFFRGLLVTIQNIDSWHARKTCEEIVQICNQSELTETDYLNLSDELSKLARETEKFTQLVKLSKQIPQTFAALNNLKASLDADIENKEIEQLFETNA